MAAFYPSADDLLPDDPAAAAAAGTPSLPPPAPVAAPAAPQLISRKAGQGAFKDIPHGTQDDLDRLTAQQTAAATPTPAASPLPPPPRPPGQAPVYMVPGTRTASPLRQAFDLTNTPTTSDPAPQPSAFQAPSAPATPTAPKAMATVQPSVVKPPAPSAPGAVMLSLDDQGTPDGDDEPSNATPAIGTAKVPGQPAGMDSQDDDQAVEAAKQQELRNMAATNRTARGQGRQMSTSATGQIAPATDNAGNGLYKPTILNPAYQNPADGEFYRVSRDQYNNEHHFRLADGKEGVDYHVDPGSGQMYVHTSGEDGGSRATVIGTDPLFALTERLREGAASRKEASDAARAALVQAAEGGSNGPSLEDLQRQAKVYQRAVAPFQERMDAHRDFLLANPGVDLDATQAQDYLAAKAGMNRQTAAYQPALDELARRQGLVDEAKQRQAQVAEDAKGKDNLVALARTATFGPRLRRDLAAIGNGEEVDARWMGRYQKMGLVDDEGMLLEAAAPFLPRPARPMLTAQQASREPGQSNTAALAAPGGATGSPAEQSLVGDEAATQKASVESASPAGVPPPSGQASSSLPPTPPAAASGAASSSPQDAGTVGVGQADKAAKPYFVNQDNSVQFDPANPTASVLAAYKDGVLDDETAKKALEAGKRVDAAKSDLEKMAGEHPELKALAEGLGTGGAFLLGSEAGAAATAPLAAGVGAAFPPAAWITTPTIEAVGTFGGGMLAAWAKKKLENKAAEYSDAVKGFQAAAQLHPNYEFVGELLPNLKRAVTSVGNFARMGTMAADALGEGASTGARIAAGAKAVAKQASGGALGGAATEAVVRPVVSTAADKALDAAGVDHEETQAPTIGSIAQMATLGALLSGGNREFHDYSPNRMASILSRGMAHMQTNTDMGESIPFVQMAEKFGNHPSVDSQRAAEWSKPLAPAEQEVFFKARTQLERLSREGKIDLNQPYEATGQQATRQGQPIDSTNVQFRQKEADPAQPSADTPSTSPFLSLDGRTPASRDNSPASPNLPAAQESRSDARISSEPATLPPFSASEQPAISTAGGQASASQLSQQQDEDAALREMIQSRDGAQALLDRPDDPSGRKGLMPSAREGTQAHVDRLNQQIEEARRSPAGGAGRTGATPLPSAGADGGQGAGETVRASGQDGSDQSGQGLRGSGDVASEKDASADLSTAPAPGQPTARHEQMAAAVNAGEASPDQSQGGQLTSRALADIKTQGGTVDANTARSVEDRVNGWLAKPEGKSRGDALAGIVADHLPAAPATGNNESPLAKPAEKTKQTPGNFQSSGNEPVISRNEPAAPANSAQDDTRKAIGKAVTVAGGKGDEALHAALSRFGEVKPVFFDRVKAQVDPRFFDKPQEDFSDTGRAYAVTTPEGTFLVSRTHASERMRSGDVLGRREGSDAIVDASSLKGFQPAKVQDGNSWDAFDTPSKGTTESSQVVARDDTPATRAPITYEQLVGERIDNKRTAFHPDSGTLGIARDQMPQIAAEHRGAMAQWLQGQNRGMNFTPEEVLPGALRPSQAEFNPGKVEKARQWAGDSQRRILVSSDNHVLDGHHQWAGHLAEHPDKPIGVLRINAPAREVLSKIHDFPSAGMEKLPDIESAPIQGGGATTPAPATPPELMSLADHAAAHPAEHFRTGQKITRAGRAGTIERIEGDKATVNFHRTEKQIGVRTRNVPLASLQALPGAKPRLVESHASAIRNSLAAGRPVNAKAADAHDIIAPSHYAKEGDNYMPSTIPPGVKSAVAALDGLVARQREGKALNNGQLQTARALRKNIETARAKEGTATTPQTPPAPVNAPATPEPGPAEEPATTSTGPRIEAPAQKFDRPRDTQARAWIADERQAGREPKPLDVSRRFQVPSDHARTLVAEQYAAEMLAKQAAKNQPAPAKASEAPSTPATPSRPDAAPSTTPPKITQPNTPEGQRAQRRISDLAKAKEERGRLTPEEVTTLLNEGEILTRDLNRQALGSNPRAVTPAGKRAQGAIDKLQEAKGMVGSLPPSDEAAWKSHLATLEKDFTTQRLAREPLPESDPVDPLQARALAEMLTVHNPGLLRKLGVKRVGFGPTQFESGIEFAAEAEGGTLKVDPAKLAVQIANVRDNQQFYGLASTPEDYVAHTLLTHEALHGAQTALAAEDGMSWPEHIEANLPDHEMPERWEEQGRAAYGPEWDSLQGWQKKSEFARMYAEQKVTGTITEGFYRYMARVLDYLKGLASGKGVSPNVRAYLDRLSARLEAAREKSGIAPTEQTRAAEDAARREYEASLKTEANEGIRDAGGVELLEALRRHGGLPTDDPAFRGELHAIRENSQPVGQANRAGTFNLFRKNALGLDELTSRLREEGFPVQTPDDLFDLLHRRITTQRPEYAFPATADANTGMQGSGAVGASRVPARRDTATGSLFSAEDEPFELQTTEPTEAEQVASAIALAKRPAASTPTETTPKLRAGEKGTGDLFQGEDAPFNLVGEKGIDHAARQKEAERVAQGSEEANSKQDREQLDFTMQAAPQTTPEPPPAAVAEPTPLKAPAGIVDFGEKIEGARKDKWGKFGRAMEEGLPADARDITLSKHFPEPDYERLLADGVPEADLATMKALRDMIPTKPQASYKQARWGELVKGLHTAMQSLMARDGAVTTSKLDAILANSRQLAHKVSLYRDLGFPSFTQAKDWTVRDGSFSTFMGERYPSPKTIAYAEHKGRMQNDIFSMAPTAAKRSAEIADKVRARLTAAAEGPAPARETQFAVYTDRYSTHAFIGKKGPNGVVRIKTGFKTAKEALDYRDANQAELSAKWEEMKAPPVLRRAANNPREGVARHEGDVSPEQFQEAFGFRGVQFGNYVEGTRRQADLNEAFDALADLSEALGVPTKALSLDGSLGLAFGARGGGNAKAHYEPGQVVINLTKTQGPGSLAHEWFHALDNYFARLDRTGSTSPAAVDAYGTRESTPLKNVRPAVWQAFRAIRDALGRGDFAKRSNELDATRSKPYYGTTIEKAARAFETYVEERLTKTGVSNDYLVNIDKAGSKAYPTTTELDGGIRGAFDHLFNTLDVKPTERGMALGAGKVEPVNTAGATDEKNAQTARAAWKSVGVKSPFFKRWFEDSKVVDAQGKPLAVFHGSPHRGIESFRTLFGPVYFAENPLYAAPFQGASGQRYAVYLNVRRPLDLTSLGAEPVSAAALGETLRQAGVSTRGLRGMEAGDERPTPPISAWRFVRQTPSLRERLEAAGYDGLKQMESFGDTPEARSDPANQSVAWGVYEPNQIKSAVPAGTPGSNSGEFDPKSQSMVGAAAVPPRGEREGQTSDPSRVATIKDLVNEATADNPPSRRRFAQFGEVSPEQAVRLKEGTGLDLAGYRRNVEGNAVRHVLKQHGDPAKEAARGNVAVTRADFERLPELLAQPDASLYAGKSPTGQDVILSAKRVNGYYVVAEEIREGKRTLNLTTMYKKSAPPLAVDAAPGGAAPTLTPEAVQSAARTMLAQLVDQRNFLRGGEKGGGNTAGAARVEPLIPDEEAGSEPAAPSKPPTLKERALAYNAARRELAALRDKISAGFDAANNSAGYHSGQARSSVRYDLPDALDRQAARLVVEAGYDPAKLRTDLARVQAAPNQKLAAKYLPAYQRAVADLPRLREATAGFRQVQLEQDAAADRAGLPVEARRRMAHIYDDPTSPESTIAPDKGLGIQGGRFKTATDALAAGVDPRSLDLADATESLVRRNQRAIGQRAFQEGLTTLKAPDGKPVLGGIVETREGLDRNGNPVASQKVPAGYETVQAGDNLLTVHKKMAPLLKGLYGESAFDRVPALRIVKDVAALAKHGTAVLDSYHASKIAYKGVLGFQTVGYDKGLATLELSDKDLERAVAAGDYTQAEADWAKANRPKLERGIRQGLNVDGMSDNLLESARQHNLIEKIPVLGPGLTHVNTFIFRKFSRGVIAQAYTVAEDRNRARHPGMSEEEVARQSAKEVNEFFGNIGNQGFLKSRTMRDAAGVIFFAPSWTESTARSEARGFGQAARNVADGLRGKGWRMGVVAQALGQTVLFALIANQALNLFTRGKPTWENPEEDHPWDAWVSGGPHNRGFWLSPLSIAAEYSHALHKYLAGGEGPVDAVAHIAANKLSGPARAVKSLVTGEDYAGRPYGSMGERLTAAGTDLLPSPMPLGSLVQKDPRATFGYRLNHEAGAGQKQLFASAGLKLDNAASARSEMFRLAEPFRKTPLSKQHGTSVYADLRHALDNGDEAGAEAEARRLVEGGKRISEVEVHGAGIHGYNAEEEPRIAPEVFTGSKESEHRMLAKLTPAQKDIYDKAQADRKENGILLAKIALKLRAQMKKSLPGSK